MKPAVLSLFLLTLAGCQCTGLSEHYSDAVDRIADFEPQLDALYHPCADVSRIGMPDWCACQVNRLWCGSGCCDGAKPQQALPCCFCAEYFPPYDPAAETSPPKPPLPAAPPAGGKLPPPPKPGNKRKSYGGPSASSDDLPGNIFFHATTSGAANAK